MKIFWTNSGTKDESFRDHPTWGSRIKITFDHRPRRFALRSRHPLSWRARKEMPAYPLVALSIGRIGLPVDVSFDIARIWGVRHLLTLSWYDGSVMKPHGYSPWRKSWITFRIAQRVRNAITAVRAKFAPTVHPLSPDTLDD